MLTSIIRLGFFDGGPRVLFTRTILTQGDEGGRTTPVAQEPDDLVISEVEIRWMRRSWKRNITATKEKGSYTML
jgi:hypothetical protein